MKNEELNVESLMELYESSPILVLYDSDLVKLDQSEIQEIVKSEGATKLNPLDVVLESLVNVVSERISKEEFTHSENTVLVNKTIHDLAVRRISDYIKNYPDTLEVLHKRWLQSLKDFLVSIKQRSLRIEEVLFQVSMKFRISSLSASKAIATLLR